MTTPAPANLARIGDAINDSLALLDVLAAATEAAEPNLYGMFAVIRLTQDRLNAAKCALEPSPDGEE